MSSHGFQYTPFGILPLDASVPTAGDTVMPGAVASAEAATVETPAARQAPAPATAARAAGPITGKQILGLARDRIREIDRLLRAVPALQAERASLQSLVRAATPTHKRKNVQ